MTVNILSTKLFSPSVRPNMVSRPRLLQFLEDNSPHLLTLISAPAGYGKSTLLSEWVHLSEKPFSWLSLDSADNDPVRFWSHFVAALRQLNGPSGNTIGAQFLESVKTSTEPELEGLANELAAITESSFLILDDFHAVNAAEIYEAVHFLVENLPVGMSGLRLMISTRNDPPWPMARLRTRGQVFELRAQDLRFTKEETKVFLNGVMHLQLKAEEITELGNRTEGWPAGLQLAALSLQFHDNVADFLSEFSGTNRFILDFLVEEVLEKQTSEILDFMLESSILPRLSGELTAAVTGQPNGQEILEKLERENLFIIALDDRRLWYRFHHLFADLLQKQLQVRFPERITMLHRRAADWFAEAFLPEEAIAHAFQTGDIEFAAEKVEGFVLTTHQRGEIKLARQWIDSLPEEIVIQRPVLCIAKAGLSATYATVELAEIYLAAAEDALQNGKADIDSCDFLNCQISILTVVIARLRGESTERQQALVQEALEDVIPVQDASSRAALLLRLGFSYMDTAEDARADQTFMRAIELGYVGNNPYAAQVAAYGRMVVARRQGMLNDLELICAEAIEYHNRPGERTNPLVGIALTMLGILKYERNHLEEARELLVEGLELLEHVRLPELLVKGRFALACVALAVQSETQLPNLHQTAFSGNPGLQRFAGALQARLQLQRQNGPVRSELMQWVDEIELSIHAQSTYDWEILEKLIGARVLCRIAQTQPSAKSHDQLQAYVDFLIDERARLESLKWWGLIFELDVVTSIMFQLLGQSSDAKEALAQALNIGAKERFVRTFLDEGECMHRLLPFVQAKGAVAAFTRELLTAFGDPARTEPDELIEGLSTRELQVLRLLNTRLSVPEIAAELHLAPTTIRTHVQNIYQKLGVHGRIEAIHRAELIGLLQ